MQMPPRLNPDAALFLDFDGTLVALAETPEAIEIPPALVALLGDLHDLLGGAEETGAVLEVLGRQIRLPHAAGGLLRASFVSLCGTALGPQDYLAIGGRFHTVFQMIPAVMRAPMVVLAAAEPDDIYPDGLGSFEFERTASRLHEMRSAAWLEKTET